MSTLLPFDERVIGLFTTLSPQNIKPAYNMVLLQAGHDVASFGCSSLSAAVSADGFQFDFLFLPSTFKNNQAFAPGGRFSNAPPDSNTGSLAVSRRYTIIV